MRRSGRIHRPITWAALSCVVVTAAACGGGSSGSGSINVGGLVPLSGGGAVYGPDIESALRIAVEEINGDAPMGRKLKLQIEDSQTDPDAATRATQKLINVNRSAAIMGVWSSAETLAIAPMAIQSGTVLTTAAGAGDVTDLDDENLVWRFYPPGRYTGAAIAQAVREQKWTSAVAMSRNDPSGLTIVKSFKDALQASGGRVVDSVTYPPNQSSYTGEVGRAIGKKADVIVNVGYTPELAAMMKDARNAPDKGTWLSVGWSVNQELFDAVGTAAAEGLYTVDAAPNVDGAAYANLRRAFQAKTGKELLASNTFAFYAYDSAIVVALAMAACECTKGAALTKAIAKVSTAPGKKVGGYAEGIAALKGGGDIDYQGAASDLEFDGKGDQRSGYGVYQVRNGKVELVKKFTLS
ncbi:ABC transporter substrate-binding protein [Actinomadura madurae]|uniref:ABC transporter substrate-binding protein n=1 Tax=Actinomadura madurae TaxID=1993 RepID=UPI0020D1F633|nr:ABC transporter substrate-binding protein [Actinomadura madurae]MCP9952602.1 ABC transporter substrate-binding protein [Actinomadura madurae]